MLLEKCFIHRGKRKVKLFREKDMDDFLETKIEEIAFKWKEVASRMKRL